MESQVSRLVDKVWDKFLKAPPARRLLIAVGGIPGSGKTTLSQTLATAINARQANLDPTSTSHPVAVFVPMDGYHLTRAQLSAMPDPARAHARRGAEFTFDGPAFFALIQSLRVPLSASTATITAPSFDHAIKDPVEGDIAIEPWHRVVILEGNYVVLAREPWQNAAALMDERWFVQVDFAVARERLIRRHVQAGIAADEIEAGRRADENDLVNGEEIVRLRLEVDEVVKSREDGTWVHE